MQEGNQTLGSSLAAFELSAHSCLAYSWVPDSNMYWILVLQLAAAAFAHGVHTGSEGLVLV